MLNYDDRFEDNCVNENIHVKYITFFLKDIKEKIKDLEKRINELREIIKHLKKKK